MLNIAYDPETARVPPEKP